MFRRLVCFLIGHNDTGYYAYLLRGDVVTPHYRHNSELFVIPCKRCGFLIEKVEDELL